MIKIVDPRYPDRDWHASSDGMKILLGLDPKSKWPAIGLKPRIIQGVKIWVNPLAGEKPNHGKRHTHRVMAECPVCFKHVSAGRLHQHVCKPK